LYPSKCRKHSSTTTCILTLHIFTCSFTNSNPVPCLVSCYNSQNPTCCIKYPFYSCHSAIVLQCNLATWSTVRSDFNPSNVALIISIGVFDPNEFV
jgi:hypothetical protein